MILNKSIILSRFNLFIYTIKPLVSYICWNKLLQTDWFYETETYSLTVLETRSPKSRNQCSWLLLVALRKNLFHASLPSVWWFLESFASLEWWTHGSDLCLCLQMVYLLHFCLCVSIFSSYKDTSHCIRT